MVLEFKSENSIGLNTETDEQKTKLGEFIQQSKIKIFNLFYQILKYQSITIPIEVLMLILKLFQNLHFIFHTSLKEIQQPYKLFETLNYLINFFHIVPFFKDNTYLYLIIYYGLVIIESCIMLLFIYMIFVEHVLSSLSHTLTFLETTTSKVTHFLLELLSTLLNYTSRMFVLPILSLFLSIYTCDNNGINVYIQQQACWKGKHLIHSTIGAIYIILFLLISVIYNSFFFEIHYNVNDINSKNNPIAATSAKANVSLLLEQVIMVIYYQFMPLNTNVWITVVILFIFSLYSLSIYIKNSPHYNSTIRLCNLAIRIIFFYCSLCLLITRIIQSFVVFKSGLYLIIFSLPLLLIIIFIYPIDDFTFNFKHISNLNKPNEFITQINALLYQIDNFHKRKAQIVLRGYAINIERTCTIKNCALSKYIKVMDNPSEAIMHFYSHIELIYQNAISKHPFNTKLRINYFLFLIQRLNKNYLALNQIAICLAIPRISLEEQFILYRYQKLDEEFGNFKYGINYSNITTYNLDEDISEGMLFKKFSSSFKENINRILFLYIDFWNLLYEEKLEHNYDLDALHNLGNKINSEISNIHTLYKSIELLKQINDLEIMRLYYDFLTEIVLDNELAKHIKSEIQEKEKMTVGINKKDIELLDNFNIYQLNKSDHFHYIVLDTNNSSFTNIVNLSIGLCPILGYSKSELIGKSIDILLPSFVRINHKLALQNELEQYLKDERNEPYVTTNNSNEQHKASEKFTQGNKKLSFKDKILYFINKAKYLVPFNTRISFYRNDKSELYWLIKIFRQDYKKEYLNNFVNDNKNVFERGKTISSSIAVNSQSVSNKQGCFIITNNKFKIQHFSTNCIKILGLNSDIINNATDISNFIKEFRDELMKFLSDKDSQKEERSVIKSNIISSIFNSPTIITWIYIEESKDNQIIYETFIDFNNETPYNIANDKVTNHHSGKISLNKDKQGKFLMIVDKITLVKNQIDGYIFKFLPNTTDNIQRRSHKRSVNLSNNFNPNVLRCRPKITFSSSDLNSNICDLKSTKRDNYQIPTKRKFSSVNTIHYDEKRFITSTQSIKDEIIDENSNVTFSPEKNQQVNIDKSFIPLVEGGKFFSFEPEQMAFTMQLPYKLNSINGSPSRKEYLKNQALHKLHLSNQLKSQTDDGEASEYSSDDIISEFSYTSQNESNIEEAPSSLCEGKNKSSYKLNIENKNHFHKTKSHNQDVSSSSSRHSYIMESKNNNYNVHNNNLLNVSGLNNCASVRRRRSSEVFRTTTKDSYYHVDFSKIKYSIYNFKKNLFEDVDFEKKSTIEKIKEQNIPFKNSDNLPSKTNDMLSSSNLKGFNSTSGIYNTRNSLGQKLKLNNIIHQIKRALKKKDYHPTLIYLRIISLIIISLLLGGSILNLMETKTSIELVHRRIFLMKSAIFLERKGLLVVNNIREILLLNFPEYDNFYIEKNAYTQTYLDDLIELHEILNNDLQEIFYNIQNIKNEENKNFIQHTEIDNYILDDNGLVYSYKFNLRTSLFKIIISIFQVSGIPNNELFPNKQEVHFAITNILNGLLGISEKLIDLFKNEIVVEISYQKRKISIIFIINAVITMSMYFAISKIYSSVLIVKESYLKIFFEIDNNVIFYSLNRCENLLKSIQHLNEQNEYLDDNTCAEGAFGSFQNDFILNNLYKDNQLTKKQLSLKNNHDKRRVSTSINFSYHRKELEEEKRIKYIIMLFMLSSVIIAVIIYIFYLSFCENVKGSSILYFSENDLQIYILLFYVSTREYIFDPNQQIYNQPLNIYIEELIEKFQEEYKNKNEYLLSYKNFFPIEYKNSKISIDREDLCVHINKFFAEQKENKFLKSCDQLLHTAPTYGLNILISSIANSLRELIREFQYENQFRLQNNLNYNLTLYGTEQFYNQTEDYQNRKELYDKYTPLNYLIGEQLNQIQFLIVKLIFPLYEDELNKLQLNIRNQLNGRKNLILMIYLSYIVFLALVYLLIWSRYMNSLRNVIFKTKNMLSIIPIEILASLSCIHRLLNINTQDIIVDDKQLAVSSEYLKEDESELFNENSEY